LINERGSSVANFLPQITFASEFDLASQARDQRLQPVAHLLSAWQRANLWEIHVADGGKHLQIEIEKLGVSTHAIDDFDFLDEIDADRVASTTTLASRAKRRVLDNVSSQQNLPQAQAQTHVGRFGRFGPLVKRQDERNLLGLVVAVHYPQDHVADHACCILIAVAVVDIVVHRIEGLVKVVALE